MIEHFIRVIVGIVGGAVIMAGIISVVLFANQYPTLLMLVAVLIAAGMVGGECVGLAIEWYDDWRHWRWRRAKRSRRSPDVHDPAGNGGGQ